MAADAAAAELLGTSTTSLNLWEERFGYPVPIRSGDGQQQYPDAMMIALRDALNHGLSISSAITEVRRVESWSWGMSVRSHAVKPHKDPEEAR